MSSLWKTRPYGHTIGSQEASPSKKPKLSGNYTAAEALLEALIDAGVTHLIVNLGSDHPAFLEAFAKWKSEGRSQQLRIIIAPHEFVALSIAQGYYQASGQMQALIVHVDAGTLNMGGAIHNVARARIPVLIISGMSPATEENELVGSRNEFIHWIQDTIDQRSITREFTVFNSEIRTGANIKQVILRASQLAKSTPGPAYLMAAREVFEEHIKPVEIKKKYWKPLAPLALSPESVTEIRDALVGATMPVIVTTYLGKDREAVKELISLAEVLGIAVVEACPGYLNFPHDHTLYQGNNWGEVPEWSVVRSADVILVMDCDVPWVKIRFQPSPETRLYHIDSDTLKVQMTLFHLPAELSCQANARTALQQISASIRESQVVDTEVQERINQRIQGLSTLHNEYIERIRAKETLTADEVITPHYFMGRLRAHLDQDTIILSEGISNFRPIADSLRCNNPGTYYTSGATALGWHGGAAIGVKLAEPDKTVVTISGDGTYLFSIPSTVHWIARKYETPFLSVILNNRGWKSPMLSAFAVHGRRGYSGSAESDDLHVTLDPPPDYAQIAVAAGAGFGTTVTSPSEVDAAIEKALRTVREEKRAAVLDVWLEKFNVGDPVG